VDGRGGSALEEAGREPAARDLQVLRRVGEDAGEGADADTGVRPVRRAPIAGCCPRPSFA